MILIYELAVTLAWLDERQNKTRAMLGRLSHHPEDCTCYNDPKNYVDHNVETPLGGCVTKEECAGQGQGKKLEREKPGRKWIGTNGIP
jgi:hypothetical protein